MRRETEPKASAVDDVIDVAKAAGEFAKKGVDAAVVPGAVAIGGTVGGVGGGGAGAAIGFLVLGPPGAAVGFGFGILVGAIGGGAGAGVAVNWAKKRLMGGR